jgi:hypothetical protein
MRSMSVIAGFDPAIHRAEAQFDSWMDARVKPAHDEWRCGGGVGLPQRNRQPAEVRVGHQPDLPAGQFQHRALLVGQHDRARAAADR